MSKETRMCSKCLPKAHIAPKIGFYRVKAVIKLLNINNTDNGNGCVYSIINMADSLTTVLNGNGCVYSIINMADLTAQHINQERLGASEVQSIRDAIVLAKLTAKKLQRKSD
ncbi:hypothetical protein GQR58_024725 [Nymphon striatum]|nr:hypothetical protein GQR58_024725 [Nymphon striatum]